MTQDYCPICLRPDGAGHLPQCYTETPDLSRFSDEQLLEFVTNIGLEMKKRAPQDVVLVGVLSDDWPFLVRSLRNARHYGLAEAKDLVENLRDRKIPIRISAVPEENMIFLRSAFIIA